MNTINVAENIRNRFSHNKGAICGIEKYQAFDYLSVTGLCYIN